MWIQCHIEIKIQIVYKSVSGDTFQFGRRTDWATQMRHMWQHELNILKQTSHWQQVLTETWNWHNMDSAANNDALYIASSVTPLSWSPLCSLLMSPGLALARTWGDNKNREPHLTLETEAWCWERLLTPAPWCHRPIRGQDGIRWPIRGRAQHMSQSSEGVSLLRCLNVQN